MNIETALEKLIEHAQAELHVRRRRDQEKTSQADHGHDYSEMIADADRLDHYAHEVSRLHDAEFAHGWRRASAPFGG